MNGRERRLSRAEVERLALTEWRATGDRSPYWLTTAQAADILGVVTSRVRQLAAAGRIP